MRCDAMRKGRARWNAGKDGAKTRERAVTCFVQHSGSAFFLTPSCLSHVTFEDTYMYVLANQGTNMKTA
jgi:hypothetical protein